MQNKTEKLTVKSLRQSGAKVRVSHNRVYKYPSDTFTLNVPKSIGITQFFDAQFPVLQARGGFTTVIVDMPDKRHFTATSKCLDTDNYSTHGGVGICLERIRHEIAVSNDSKPALQ